MPHAGGRGACRRENCKKGSPREAELTGYVGQVGTRCSGTGVTLESIFAPSSLPRSLESASCAGSVVRSNTFIKKRWGAIVKDLGLIDNAPSSHTVGEQFISFLDNDVDAHVSLLDRRHRSHERPGTRPPHLSPRGG